MHQSRHKELRTTGDPKVLTQLWMNLSKELNSFGSGATKTIAEWKETFAMWQSRTRLKARSLQTDPTSVKPLTDLEERALSVWGKTVNTTVGVGCVGIDNDSEEEVDRWFEQSQDVSNASELYWGGRQLKLNSHRRKAIPDDVGTTKVKIESTHWPDAESDEEWPTMTSGDDWRPEPAAVEVEPSPSNHSVQTHSGQMKTETVDAAVPPEARTHQLPDPSGGGTVANHSTQRERVPQSMEKVTVGMGIAGDDSNDQHDEDYYEDQMFRAIGRLTERMGDVAEQIASGNELLKSVLANQDKIIATLLK